MKETTIDSTLILKWIKIQPVMPKARYIEPLIKELSITHTVPEQNFQIIQHTTSLTSTIHDEAQPLTNQTIESAEQSQISASAKMNQQIESEEISSNSPVSEPLTDQPPDIPSENMSKEVSTDSPVSELITYEKTNDIQIIEPVIPSIPTNPPKEEPNLFVPLMSGLCIIFFMIWIINPKPDNDNNVQTPPTLVEEKPKPDLVPHFPNRFPLDETITLPESTSRRENSEEILIKKTLSENNLQSPQDFIIEYYQDISRNDVEAVVAKWKAPKKLEKLRSVVADVDWFEMQNLSTSYSTPNHVQISIDVITGQGSSDWATQKSRWAGTIDLEKVDGNWKIIRMKLKQLW